MATPTEQDGITPHKAQGLWQALMNAGKRDWAKTARAMAYQMDADAKTIREQAARIAELEDVCEYTLAQIEYLQGLWGKEGVTDAIKDRIAEVLRLNAEAAK